MTSPVLKKIVGTNFLSCFSFDRRQPYYRQLFFLLLPRLQTLTPTIKPPCRYSHKTEVKLLATASRWTPKANNSTLLHRLVQVRRREEQELGGRRMTVSSTNPHNKEIAIRKRMIGIFNKREDDFPSLREYNDYLEEVEDMTTDLIEGIDVAVIEAKIAKYQEENAEQIMVNRARKAEELAAATAASKGHPAQADNDVGASQNSQAGFGAVPQGQYAPTFPGGQPRPTGMGPQPLPLGGGDMGYAVDDEEAMRLRARAGGWSIEISRKRALDEAFGSMWVC